MKKPGGNDADAARHPYGPRPIGALVATIARPAFKKRAPAAAQVLSDWDEIVGLYDVLLRITRRWWSSTVRPPWRCATAPPPASI